MISPAVYFPIAFAALTLRYLLLSGLAYLIFWKWLERKFAPRRIQDTVLKDTQVRSEIKWSILSFLIFAASVSVVLGVIGIERTKIYWKVSDHGWGYFAFSVLLLLIGHDTYFYWTHRLMHHKWLFKRVHLVHHLSTSPTPFTAFAFHPLETLIEQGFFFVAVFLMPIHPAAILGFFFFSHVMNVMGHLGFEIFPCGFTRKPIAGFVNTSTHHNMHHKYFTGNYSFYFNFWDRLMSTNRPDYHETFQRVVENASAAAYSPENKEDQLTHFNRPH